MKERAGFLKTVKLKWSLWKFSTAAVINFIGATVCYSIGWHMCSAKSSMPLARSGAAATAVAIACTIYDYRGALIANQDRALASFKRVTDQLKITGAEAFTRIADKLNQNTKRAVNVTSIIHGLLLIVATVIWGFGDLIPAK